MSIAGAAAAQNCPGNFFDILESKADTTAAKQDIGNACKGRDVTFRGTVLDIVKRGDVFELHLASEASGNSITVTMRDSPGADMSKLRKGAVVTIAAKLRSFTGVLNEYVTLEDGSCKDCGR